MKLPTKKASLWLDVLFGLVLCLVLISLVSFRDFTNQEMDHSIQMNTKQMSQANSKLLENLIQQKELELELIGTQLGPLESSYSQKVLAQYRNRNFQELYLLTPDYKVLTEDHWEMDPHFELLQTTSENQIIPGKEDGIIIIIPLNNGYLAGSLSAKKLSELADLHSFDHNGFAHVFSGDGKILIVSNSQEQAMQLSDKNVWNFYNRVEYINGSSLEEFEQKVAKGQSGFVDYKVDGERRIAYYTPSGIKDWYIMQVSTQGVINMFNMQMNDSVISLITKILLSVIMLIMVLFLLNMRSKRAILEAQNQIERLTNNIRGGVLKFTANQHGTIEFISEGYLKMLGVTREDVKNKFDNSFYQLIYEEDRENVRNELHLDSISPGDEINLEYRLRMKDNEWIWVLDKLAVMADASGRKNFYSIIVDATDVKKMEWDLKDTNQRFKLVADSHLESRIFEYNIENQRITFVPGKFLEFDLNDYSGLTTHEFANKGLIDPSYIQEFLGIFDSIQGKNRFASSVVKVISRESGESRWIRVMLTKLEDSTNNRVVGSLRDITEEKETQNKLIQEKQQNKLMMEGAIMSYTINVSQNTVVINPVGTGHKEQGPKKVYDYIKKIQVLLESTVYPEDLNVFMEEFSLESLIRNFNIGNTRRSVEYRQKIKGKKGFFWVRAHISLVKDPATGDILCFVYINDVDKDIRKNVQLQEKAETDYLTGVYNRAGLIKRMDNYFGTNYDGGLCAFYSIDLDEFKSLNDTYGHLAGDDMLKSLGKKLQKMFRKHDLIGRMGGDEFVVFIKSCPSEEFIIRKANEILVNISEIQIDGTDYRSFASVGVAIAPKNGTSFKELYETSDKALYTAKRKGKNIFAIYSQEEEGEQDEVINR